MARQARPGTVVCLNIKARNKFTSRWSLLSNAYSPNKKLRRLHIHSERPILYNAVLISTSVCTANLPTIPPCASNCLTERNW